MQTGLVMKKGVKMGKTWRVELSDGAVVEYNGQKGTVKTVANDVTQTHRAGLFARFAHQSAEDKLEEAIRKHGPIVKYL